MNRPLSSLLDRLEEVLGGFVYVTKNWLRQNKLLLAALISVTAVTYGFELFNLNITIDDEMSMLKAGPDLILVAIDRWAAYLLSVFFLPYPALPVVSLAFSFVLHVLGAVLLCDAWEVRLLPERIIAGGILISFPSWAYLYSFAPIAPFMGPGLFFCAASLAIFARAQRGLWLFAALPAGVALGIHLSFLPLLITAYAIYFAVQVLQGGEKNGGLPVQMLVTLVLAISFHLLVNQLILQALSVQRWDYTEGYLDGLGRLFTDPSTIVHSTLSLSAKIYSGDVQVYGVSVYSLPILTIAATIKIATSALSSLRGAPHKQLLIIALVALIILVNLFALSALSRGRYRLLVGVSATIAGIYALSTLQARLSARLVLFVLGGLVIFQFAQATNRWSASSYLSMQVDRALATRVIAAIERKLSRQAAPAELKYLEVVGGYRRPPSYAIFSKADVSNDSLFQRGPRSTRVAALLNLLGFPRLTETPPEKRLSVVDYALQMPAWPAEGSVEIVDDIVIIKFSSYEKMERRALCKLAIQFNHPLKDTLCAD